MYTCVSTPYCFFTITLARCIKIHYLPPFAITLYHPLLLKWTHTHTHTTVGVKSYTKVFFMYATTIINCLGLFYITKENKPISPFLIHQNYLDLFYQFEIILIILYMAAFENHFHYILPPKKNKKTNSTKLTAHNII